MRDNLKQGPGDSLDNEHFKLAAFQNGDKATFKWVYNRLAKALLYYATNFIDSPTDAEDIIASAFLKLYRARQGMQSYDHVKRSLYVIVRNESIDHLRSRIRSRNVQKDLGYLTEAVEEMMDLEMLKSTLLQSLWESIEKLPRQRKTILQLYFFEKKSTSEIAQQLGLNSQTVLNHKTRALESLRKTVLMPDWLLLSILGIIHVAYLFPI